MAAYSSARAIMMRSSRCAFVWGSNGSSLMAMGSIMIAAPAVAMCEAEDDNNNKGIMVFDKMVWDQLAKSVGAKVRHILAWVRKWLCTKIQMEYLRSDQFLPYGGC